MSKILLKNVFTIFALSAAALAAGTSWALTHVKIESDHGAVLYQTDIADVSPFMNVGEMTISVLRGSGLTFRGDETGIEAISGLESRNEVVSATEAKLYGWCFKINDIAPDTMPDETAIPQPLNTLTWFYGYAHYVNGDWQGYCVVDGAR